MTKKPAKRGRKAINWEKASGDAAEVKRLQMENECLRQDLNVLKDDRDRLMAGNDDGDLKKRYEIVRADLRSTLDENTRIRSDLKAALEQANLLRKAMVSQTEREEREREMIKLELKSQISILRSIIEWAIQP
jgi:hypothetical protein